MKKLFKASYSIEKNLSSLFLFCPLISWTHRKISFQWFHEECTCIKSSVHETGELKLCQWKTLNEKGSFQGFVTLETLSVRAFVLGVCKYLYFLTTMRGTTAIPHEWITLNVPKVCNSSCQTWGNTRLKPAIPIHSE